jgi:hypothetical protein
MGLTNLGALMLWVNVTAPLGPPGARTAIMEWLLKPEPDKIPDYLLCLIEVFKLETAIQQENQCRAMFWTIKGASGT